MKALSCRNGDDALLIAVEAAPASKYIIEYFPF